MDLLQSEHACGPSQLTRVERGGGQATLPEQLLQLAGPSAVCVLSLLFWYLALGQWEEKTVDRRHLNFLCWAGIKMQGSGSTVAWLPLLGLTC